MDLTKAIDDAKTSGVSVKMGETKLFQSREELDAYVKDTIAKLKDATVKASELKKARSQEDEAYKKAKSEYDKALDQYNKDKAEYDKKLKSYTEGLAKFQKDQQDLTKRNDILSSKDGIVVYGKYDEANKGSVKYYSQIGVGLSDYNKYPNLSFVKEGDYIGYHDDSVITDVKIKKANYDKSNSGDRTWVNANDYAKGDSFKLTNVATTTDGAKLDMIVTFKEDFKPILTEQVVNDQTFGNFSFHKYNQDGGAITFDARNSDNIDLDFKFVDQKTGKPVELLTANIESDLDNYQSSLLEYSTIKSAITLIPQGSDSELRGGAVVSKFNDGVDDANAIPKGSFVSIGIGDTIHHQFRPNTTLDRTGLAKHLRTVWNASQASGNIDIYKKAGYTYQLFGKSAAVNLNVFKEKKPVEPKEPEKPRLTNAASKAPSVEISEASMVITKHFDIVTGKELTKEEEGTKPKRSFDGYEFVETKTKDGNTLHFYKPIDKTPIKPKEDKKVYTRHYDKSTGKELAPQEDGTKPKREFDGYKFVETKTKDGDTEHYYEPIKKTYTKFIDKATGKELLPQEDGNNPKKDIPGYRFVETKDEDGNTIHYYEKVITKHLDIDTGKEIAEQEDGQKPKKNIDGYEFVETKDDKGNTLHYYRKVKKETPKKEEPKKEEPKKEEPKKSEPVKEKTPTKYADTNESTGILTSVLGAISLMILASLTFIKKRQK